MGKSLDDEDILEWLGISGTRKSVLSEVTYFTCLKMLAETLGKLPINYYQRTERGKIRAEPDEAYNLLAVRPNPIMTPTTFWTAVENNRNHYGNAYVWIRRKFIKRKYGGEYIPQDLWIMPSNCVSALMDNKGVFGNKGKLYYQYSDKDSGEIYVFRSEEVMHFRTSHTFDGITGKPVCKILEDTVAGAHSSQEYVNSLYKNGLTGSATLQFTGDVEEKHINALRKRFEKYTSGVKNAGRLIPVPYGFQIQPLNIKLTDAQFFELKKYTALQIAGAFGIKPNQINNYEKSSYANSEMQQLSFLVDTELYILKQYEEEMAAKLLPQEKIDTGHEYKFNEKAILRTDSKTQMENLISAVNGGLYTANEGREYLDKPHKEGGDILIVNGSCIPLTEVGKQYKGGENIENRH